MYMYISIPFLLESDTYAILGRSVVYSRYNSGLVHD